MHYAEQICSRNMILQINTKTPETHQHGLLLKAANGHHEHRCEWIFDNNDTTGLTELFTLIADCNVSEKKIHSAQILNPQNCQEFMCSQIWTHVKMNFDVYSISISMLLCSCVAKSYRLFPSNKKLTINDINRTQLHFSENDIL